MTLGKSRYPIGWFDDQVYCEPILDTMLCQTISILQDLASKDQTELLYWCSKLGGHHFFELKNKNKSCGRGTY